MLCLCAWRGLGRVWVLLIFTSLVLIVNFMVVYVIVGVNRADEVGGNSFNSVKLCLDATT